MKRRSKTFVQMTLNHFRELYRNKIALFFNLMFPLLLVVIFGGLFNTDDKTSVTPVGVTAETGVADVVVDALTASGLYTVHAGTEAVLEEELRTGRLRAVMREG